MDLGRESSYLALGKRTPVYGSDEGFVGVVKRVECDRADDIFDGLVLSTPAGRRFMLAEEVASVHEHGVEAKFPAAAAVDHLREPARDHDEDPDAPTPWSELLNWLVERIGIGRREDPRLHAAEERLAVRQRALHLAHDNPALALEAGVGRPDVPGAFDGGLVDLNHASSSAVADLPGVDQVLARRIVDARPFCSVEELGMAFDLSGDDVERLRGLVVFLPDSEGASK